MADLQRVDPAAVATGFFFPSDPMIQSLDGSQSHNRTLEIDQVTEAGRISVRASETQTWTPVTATVPRPKARPRIRPIAAGFMAIGAFLTALSVASVAASYLQSADRIENQSLKRQVQALETLNASKDKRLAAAKEVLCER